MISTAVMLATGDGVDQDVGAAADWYATAAARGSAHAMRGLGAMHFFEDLGRDSDRNLGLALLELGEEGGDEMASSLLDAAQSDSRRIDRDEVDRLKAEWRERVATAAASALK
jgi:TPR repeat protein